MKNNSTYYSLIYYMPDNKAKDYICVGLIFVDDKDNSIIDYSWKKIDKVNSLYRITNSSLIKNYLKNLKSTKLNFSKVQYLSDYENGNLRFTKPTNIFIKNFEKDFEFYYEKYVRLSLEATISPKKTNKTYFRQSLKRNYSVNNHLNIGYTIKHNDVNNLLIKNMEVDFIGGNGSVYCGQIIDLKAENDTIASNIARSIYLYTSLEKTFDSINKFDPKNCKFILINTDGILTNTESDKKLSNKIIDEKNEFIVTLENWKKENDYDIIESNNENQFVETIVNDIREKNLVRFDEWKDKILSKNTVSAN